MIKKCSHLITCYTYIRIFNRVVHDSIHLFSASDFNFERINIDSPCIPVRGYDPYAVPSDCPEGANYTVSSG